MDLINSFSLRIRSSYSLFTELTNNVFARFAYSVIKFMLFILHTVASFFSGGRIGHVRVEKVQTKEVLNNKGGLRDPRERRKSLSENPFNSSFLVAGSCIP